MHICLTFLRMQENCSLMVPWVLGFIGSISLEALAIVYSNVLRDHINQVCHTFLSKQKKLNNRQMRVGRFQIRHGYCLITNDLKVCTEEWQTVWYDIVLHRTFFHCGKLKSRSLKKAFT